MKNVFIKDNSTDTYDYIEEGVMFGDYLWNDITDQDITNDRLLSIKPFFYVRMSSDYLVVSVDEYEVIRLVDYEKLSHGRCAAVMDISRTTVTEIYDRARYKISDFIVTGKQLVISGGNYRICSEKHKSCCERPCRKYEENSEKCGN